MPDREAMVAAIEQAGGTWRSPFRTAAEADTFRPRDRLDSTVGRSGEWAHMATTALQPTGLKAERRFYLSMGFATLAVVVIGFTPSFYLRGVVPPYEPFLALTPLVILHGSLFSAWILFFLSQVSLVSAGRLDLHRRLGVVGAMLAGAMIFVGILTALTGEVRHSGPPIVPPASWLAVPLFDIALFTGMVSTALYNRANPQTHKRLMLLTTTGLVSAAVGRLPLSLLAFPMMILIAQGLLLTPLIIWDLKTRGRIHPATLGGGAAIFGTWLLRVAVWKTGPWLAFAAWATGLVG